MAEHRAGEPRQPRQREVRRDFALPPRPIDDRGRQRMGPPRYDPVAFKATVEATEGGMERRLSFQELRELREYRATPAELLTRDTVRRGLGRQRLTNRELDAIRAGVDPNLIIAGNLPTITLPEVSDNETTSYLPKMTRLDDATVPNRKNK